jgi:MFS family permease
LALGLIGFAALVPVGLVSLVGGVISDRLPRRRLILTTQLVLAAQALILTLLTWAGWIEIWHILLMTFVVGAADAIEQPARFAFLMDIVGKEDFTNAVGLNSAMVSAAGLVGPALAGILIGKLGEASCFLLNGVSYLIVVLVFLFIRVPTASSSSRSMRLKADLLEGFKYVYTNKTIRGALLVTAASYTFSRSYVILLPVFAQDVLRLGAQGYGWLMSAVGAGSACGALVAAGIRQQQHARWLVGASLFFSALLVFFAASPWLLPSLGLLFVASASQFVQQVLTNSMIQLAAADEYRGRMVALFSLFSNGLTRLGGVSAGAIAQFWSAPLAVAGGAILTLVWMLVVLCRVPFIRWAEEL